ncbi:translocation/assembly module TamB domain-containing protein [Desulfogranum japonicum]|uniref:hypothetical protein n=1 Tax=Desulfogranum japonicum TaxID=231447 RepID=UPI00048E82C0|nr:hypothetical protein [Desulfogranum japonicum]
MSKQQQRIRWVLYSSLGLCLFCIAILPTCIGFNPILKHLFSFLNASQTFSTQVQSCSFGWFTPLSCSNFIYQDSDVDISVAEIHLDRGLLKLLLAHKNPGKVAIINPAVTLSSGKGESGNANDAEEKQNRQDTNPLQEELYVAGKPVWEGLSLELEIRNGTLHRQNDDGHRYEVLQGLDLDASLFNGTVEYTCSLASPLGSGKAKASGFFNLPAGKKGALTSLVSQTTLTVEQLDLEPLTLFVASRGNLPQGKGRISGQWQVQTAGLDHLNIKGNAAIQGLQLYGGVLGTDRPEFSSIELSVDLEKQKLDQLVINTIDLHSDLLNFQAVGQLSGTVGSMQVDGSVHLPRMFALFPQTMRTREGLQLDKGQVDFSVLYQLKGSGKSDLTMECTSETIRGQVGSVPLYWDQPITAEVSLVIDRGISILQNLQLQTSFAQLNGSGALDNFAMHGWADLAQAQKQLGQLVELPVELQGKASWDSSVTLNEQDRYLLESDFQITDFALGKESPPGTLLMNVRASGQRDLFQGGRSGICDIRLDSQMGTFTLQAKDIRLQPAVSASYSFDSHVELEKFSSFFRSLNLSDVKMNILGVIDLEASGRYSPDVYDIDHLLLNIQDFVLQQGPIGYEDTHVQLKIQPPPQVADVSEGVRIVPLRIYDTRQEFLLRNGVGIRILPGTRQLNAQHLQLDTGLLKLTDSSIVVDDYSHPMQKYQAHVQASFQAENVLDVLIQKHLVPQDFSAHGTLDILADTSTNGLEQKGTFQIHGKETEIKKHEKIVFPQQEIQGHADFVHDWTTNSLQLENVTFDSGLGMLQGQLHSDPELNVMGNASLSPDYGAVSKLLTSLTGKTIMLEGKQAVQVEFGTEKPGKEETTQLLPSLHSSVNLDRLAFETLLVSKLQSTLELERGAGSFTLQGELNNGKIYMQPSLDFSEIPHVLMVQQPQRVLDEVNITESLSEQLLSRMHPLLGVFVQPTGTISVLLNHLLYPLEKPENVLFAASLNMRNVQMARNGLFASILSVTGLGEGDLQIADSELNCEGNSSRVTCSPIHLLVGETAVTLTGSMSYSGELDYVFQIPVTRNLVGKDAYEVLEGSILKVPVSGTVHKPRCDMQALQQNIGALLEKAAEKSIQEELLQAVPDLWDKIFSK